jgi:ABC-2 type transport system permease protein
MNPPATTAELPATTAALHEVPGPSAFGGELKRFRDLLWMISATEFRARYANTALGYAWTILRPLLYFGVIFLIMRHVLRIGGTQQNYAFFLMLNIVLFQFFSETTARGVRAVAASEAMVRKVQFPRIIIPLSVSLTAGYTLVLNLSAVFFIFLVFGPTPTWTWLGMIPIALLLFVFSTAVAMILSVLFVRWEDTGQVWDLVARALFFASPILWPLERVAPSFWWVVNLNPLALLLEQARIWTIDPSAPGGFGAGGAVVAIPVVLSLATIGFGIWWFAHEAPQVAEMGGMRRGR